MNFTNEQKLALIRMNGVRLWDYLKETIDFIENKYYLNEDFDIDELLIYCKSCEEDYKEIKILTYEIEHELCRLEN